MNRFQRRAMSSKKPGAIKARETATERRQELREKIGRELERRRVRLPLLAATQQERLDAHIEREKPAGLSCTKGCSACCRQLVLTSAAEVANILQTHPEAVRAALPRLQAQAALGDRLAAAGNVPSVLDPLSEPQAVQAAADRWWLEQQDCAFLTEEKTCSIYSARPLACRAYHVASPAELCASPDIGTQIQAWFPSTRDGVQLGLWDAERDEKGQVIVGPLPTLVVSLRASLHTLEVMERNR